VVSGNYFTVLGAQPMMGRLFLPGEGRTAGADAIIVLTYDTWKNRFAADPHIVGQLVKINGLPFTVVGVPQPKFVGAQWGTALSGFVPISMLPLMNPGGDEVFTNRGYTSVFMMGRLQQGASLAQARAATSLVMARLLKDYPQYHPPVEAAVVLRESMCRPTPIAANFTPLVASALMVMALLVLAITVANVANLLYARTADREREVAIRGAMAAIAVTSAEPVARREHPARPRRRSARRDGRHRRHAHARQPGRSRRLCAAGQHRNRLAPVCLHLCCVAGHRHQFRCVSPFVGSSSRRMDSTHCAAPSFSSGGCSRSQPGGFSPRNCSSRRRCTSRRARPVMNSVLAPMPTSSSIS
jgi:hypothetical protein